jgi:hypothetical protein
VNFRIVTLVMALVAVSPITHAQENDPRVAAARAAAKKDVSIEGSKVSFFDGVASLTIPAGWTRVEDDVAQFAMEPPGVAPYGVKDRCRATIIAVAAARSLTQAKVNEFMQEKVTSFIHQERDSRLTTFRTATLAPIGNVRIMQIVMGGRLGFIEIRDFGVLAGGKVHIFHIQCDIGADSPRSRQGEVDGFFASTTINLPN